MRGVLEQAIVARAARHPVGLDEFFLHRRQDIVVEGALHDEQRHQRRLFPALDDNVLPAMQEKFVEAYRAAGGTCDYRLFEDSTHEWVAEPGPQTDKARTTVKEFIARQLKV